MNDEFVINCSSAWNLCPTFPTMIPEGCGSLHPRMMRSTWKTAIHLYVACHFRTHKTQEMVRSIELPSDAITFLHNNEGSIRSKWETHRLEAIKFAAKAFAEPNQLSLLQLMAKYERVVFRSRDTFLGVNDSGEGANQWLTSMCDSVQNYHFHKMFIIAKGSVYNGKTTGTLLYPECKCGANLGRCYSIPMSGTSFTVAKRMLANYGFSFILDPNHQALMEVDQEEDGRIVIIDGTLATKDDDKVKFQTVLRKIYTYLLSADCESHEQERRKSHQHRRRTARRPHVAKHRMASTFTMFGTPFVSTSFADAFDINIPIAEEEPPTLRNLEHLRPSQRTTMQQRTASFIDRRRNTR